MQRWRGLSEVPAGWGRCVVTIGVFDGVHLGHAELITKAVKTAAQQGLPCVVLTFDPHPSEVIRPGSHPPVLTTVPRKAELLEQLGVDALCVLPFTVTFSRLSPAEFAHETLVDGLHAATVLVGENFTFGFKAEGDVAELTRIGATFGFSVQGVGLVAGADATLSATYVRSCVEAGDVEAAGQALGRPFRLDGVVVRGDQRGRLLGYPTANLRLDRYAAVPADGVYAGRAVRLDEWGGTVGRGELAARDVSDPWLAVAAVSVGTNPTFEGKHRQVEAFLLDFDGDLYGEGLGLEFTHRLRGMEKFDSVDDLIVQMADDVARARELVT
ncbi:MAG: bifunctional riboflavin kinase/FAD synthetase [Jatrophihabitans sp.]